MIPNNTEHQEAEFMRQVVHEVMVREKIAQSDVKTVAMAELGDKFILVVIVKPTAMQA
jgi:hypothetical protein